MSLIGTCIRRYQGVLLGILLPALVLAYYVSPMFLLGTGSNVTIHDHLDGAYVRLKVLAESGLMFGPIDATIPNVMNGAPRASYGTEFNVLLWLVYAFGPYPAFVLNQIIMRIFAFVGMYLLLKRHVLGHEKNDWILVGAALAFACLPFYPHFGLSVAGQALVLYAFLNIRQSDSNWKDWLIIALVPFYSIFGISYAFLLGAMAALLLYDWYRQSRLNREFAAAIVLMFGVAIVVDYRLVLSTFFQSLGFVSHRVEFSRDSITLNDALQGALENFIYGQGHAASLQQMVILPVVGIAAVTLLFRRERAPLFITLLGLAMAFSLWNSIWPFIWQETRGFSGGIPFFNLGRFHYLHPVLWYALFALALSVIGRHLRFGRVLVLIAIVAQVTLLFDRSDQRVNANKWQPSYEQFFATQLFSEIDQTIGKDKSQYRVVSIGIHPSISQYNGFYTLDGLFYNYPLAYKHQFRTLIAGELEKSPEWRKYYDKWGSRFYIFSKDLQDYQHTAFMLRKQLVHQLNIKIENLSLNTDVFQQMGGRYIFSAVEIVNPGRFGFRLVKKFDHPNSAWEIYLYELIRAGTA